MKKKLFFVPLLVIFVTGLFYFFQKPKAASAQEILEIFTFPEATLAQQPLTASVAEDFPTTLVIAAEDSKSTTLIFYSPPVLRKILENIAVPEGVSRGNITFVRSGERILGILSDRELPNIDASDLFKSAGYTPTTKDDLVMLSMKNSPTQRAVLLDFLPEISPEKLDGVPCKIQALNVFPNDSTIYAFSLQGTLRYISPAVHQYIGKFAIAESGNKFKLSDFKGAYVMRIPDSLLYKMPGTDGGSVTVNVGGEERFFGITNGYMNMKTVASDTVSQASFIVLRPITMRDVEM